MDRAERVVARIQDDLDRGLLPRDAVIDGVGALTSLVDLCEYLPSSEESAFAAEVDALLATAPLRRRTPEPPPWRGLRRPY
jgi:hypothetical protein